MLESGVGKIELYESILKQNFPKQLLQKYAEVVQKKAESTGTRAQYQGLVEILNRMKKYPGGLQLAMKIVNEWRHTYRRRRAMMDELNHFLER